MLLEGKKFKFYGKLFYFTSNAAAEKGKLSIEESLIEELIRKGAKEIKAVSSNSMMNF